jgi:hypothetical protein
MKHQLAVILVTFCSLFSFSQKTNSQLHPITKLDIGLQGFGIDFERKLGRLSTIDFATGIGTGGYEIESGNFTYVVNPLRPAAYFSATPKFYYNLAKRAEKGKSTEANSGNYIGLRIKYTTRGIESTETQNALLLNVHWGLQRIIAKRWTVNSHFGAGYSINAGELNKVEGTFYPAIDLKFSYLLN